MAVPFFVSVIPALNQVHLGDNATFECFVSGGVHIDRYEWVGSQKIAREERFSHEQMNRILHVHNVKEYDNNTLFDCTATDAGGRDSTATGRIVVLPLLPTTNTTNVPDGSVIDGTMTDGWVSDGHNSVEPLMEGFSTLATTTWYNNGTMTEPDAMETTEHNNGTMMEPAAMEGIPPLTAGGGVVIAFGFILVIAAMFGALRWLKKREVQKQEDIETVRNRYSTIEPALAVGARYDRDDDDVKLACGEDAEHDDDSYEDMLPVVAKRSTSNSPPDVSPQACGPAEAEQTIYLPP